MNTRNVPKVPAEAWTLDVQVRRGSERLVIYDAVRRRELLSVDIRGKARSLRERLDQLTKQHGVPESIRTDSSVMFTGHEFRQWLRDQGIQHIVTVPISAPDWERN